MSPVASLRAFFEDASVSWVAVTPAGEVAHGRPPPAALLPGSFNPFHHGHDRLAKVARALLDGEVALELSIINVDKPPLGEAEVRRRLDQFEASTHVVLTRAPRFIEKARLFPGAAFVIGWDTAERLVQPRYYDGSPAAMEAAFEELARLRARFIVAGRTLDGEFRTLEPSDVPARFAHLFEAIPESLFRADVSSTELRASQS